MSNTPNLDIPLVETHQSQKEVTMNSAIWGFERALTESTEIECDDGVTVVTDEEARGAVHLLLTEGSLSAAFTVELPAIKRLQIVTNSTGHEATIVCADAESGAAEATIKAGESAVLYCDGAQVFGMSAEVSGVSFTDLDGVPASYSGAGGMLVRVNAGATALEFSAAPLQTIAVACSDETTDLTTGVAKVTFRMPYAFTLQGVRASLNTAPTGAALVVDINESGSSILSTKLSIDATEKTSATAASAAVISDASLADDAEITIDVDQIGSTIAGAGLKVYLIGRPT